MGTHPIFESDFDCLTDGFLSSLSPGRSKRWQIYVPSRRRRTVCLWTPSCQVPCPMGSSKRRACYVPRRLFVPKARIPDCKDTHPPTVPFLPDQQRNFLRQLAIRRASKEPVALVDYPHHHHDHPYPSWRRWISQQVLARTQRLLLVWREARAPAQPRPNSPLKGAKTRNRKTTLTRKTSSAILQLFIFSRRISARYRSTICSKNS